MTYQPEAFEVLAERAFKAIQDAHNSGYILGNENAEARIIKLLEEQAEGDLLFAQDLNNPSKDVAYTMFKGNVIALIKEENK